MSQGIIILSEDFGIGHKSVANVMEQSLKRHVPDAIIRQYNPTSQVFPVMLTCAKYAYFFTLRHFPKIWGTIYYGTNGLEVSTRSRYIVDLFTEQFHRKQLARVFYSYDPKIVICTHPFAQELAGIAFRNRSEVTMITIVTDYSAHRLWIADRTDLYFVADAAIKRQFVAMGVAEKKIIVTGMPIDPKFDRPKSPKPQGQQTLLVLGGGMGLNIDYQMVATLAKRLQQTKIMIVCGKNRKLYEQLQHMTDDYENLHVLGFVNHMDELLDQADLVVTKPGGVTIAECIAKQVPMVLTNPIPGQEEDNVKFLLEKQAGIYIERLYEEGMESVIDLLSDTDYLQTVSSNMQQLFTRGAAQTCAQIVGDLLKEPTIM